LNGRITGTGGIDWCTPAVLTLGNGANSFQGGVDMRDGTLNLISTGAAGTGPIVLETGGGLLVSSGVTVNNSINFVGTASPVAGNGTIATAFTANGGNVINPSASNGNGVGTLTFSGGLTIEYGAAIHFDLYDAAGAAGTGYSTISSTGGTSFTTNGGGITFNLVSSDASGNSAAAINFNSSSPYSWTVLTSSTAITGFSASQFNLITSGFLNGTGGGLFSFAEVGDTIVLDFTPVPEPSTWALLGLGLLALVPAGLRWRRAGRVQA
jgi:hypothetical protein